MVKNLRKIGNKYVWEIESKNKYPHLKILENWSNVAQPILRNGRTGYLAPENLAGEEEKEAWLAE